MTIPDMMMAAYLPEPATVVYDLLPTPDPHKDGVLVKVRLASIHLEDTFFYSQRYEIANDLPHILGSDAVGEIVALGDEVEDWSVGQRVVFTDYDVLGAEKNGTHAEYVTVPTSKLCAVPDDMPDERAITVGYALVHAWIGLTYSARIRKRETVVINGASTTLGLAAIAIARWKEATIIAIDSPDKASQLRQAGADMVFDHNSADLLTLLMTATDDKGASIVVDLLGYSTLATSINLLAIDGRVLSLNTYTGDTIKLNLQDLLAVGGTLHTASPILKDGDYVKLLQMVADADLAIPTDRTFRLSEAEAAYQYVASGAAMGLVLLEPDNNTADQSA